VNDSAQSRAPKRLAGEAAFNQAKKKIAERNEASPKLLARCEASEQRKARQRREGDLR
jgi:hypothetical protein